MKVLRWAAIAVITLMSLMNLGSGTGTDLPGAVIAVGIVAGLAGLGAAFGLVRRLGWGVPVALGVSTVNLVLAVVGTAEGWEGGTIGIVVNVVALVLTLLASSGAWGSGRVASTV